jgi:hypothetical protein
MHGAAFASGQNWTTPRKVCRMKATAVHVLASTVIAL